MIQFNSSSSSFKFSGTDNNSSLNVITSPVSGASISVTAFAASIEQNDSPSVTVSIGKGSKKLTSPKSSCPFGDKPILIFPVDRKSTRLNSSHVAISYAVFCLKKKKKYTT